MSGGGQILCSSTVRHVACSLLYCCEGETPTEGRIRKQILVSSIVSMLYTPWAVFQKDEEHFLSWQMASKAGRTWLDCKNPQNADLFLNLAVKVKEREKPTTLKPQGGKTPLKSVVLQILLIPRAWKLSTANWHLEPIDHLIPLCRRGMWRRIFFAFSHSRRNRWAEAHLMFNTFDVNVCSCDIWQLEQCRSDRLSPWCVRQQRKKNNEKGRT